ncbi:hypothetical protein Goklo_017613 [Gossypium klotzschianum]|uniref:Uncharacterized protein n=1 Tax=Gossypium klotzschianum TaxID=34286 RepID=A0A7J8UI51_9ROSI|nr:hypothetical protein [Gossypium klotzschianum]
MVALVTIMFYGKHLPVLQSYVICNLRFQFSSRLMISWFIEA